MSSEVWLVTGGAGFIGSHLAEELVRRGERVRVADNFATGRLENLEPVKGELELLEGDLADPQVARRAVQGVGVVLHQAAIPSVPRSVSDPISSHQANVTATLNLLLAARDAGVRRVVYASSSSVYGDHPGLPKREEYLGRPLSPYAVSKLAGEHYCRLFWELYRLETVSLRYFNVFGPRQDPSSQYAAAIARFSTIMLNGQRPVVYGDGEQSRDFTFVSNVVQANLLAAATGGAAGQVFNIACGERTTINQILAHLERLAGRPASPVYQPPRPGDIPHSWADISKAARLLGYHPQVGLVQGLEATLRWARQQIG